MSEIQINNHQVEGYIKYDSDRFPASDVFAAFGDILSICLHHGEHEPLDTVYWEYDAGLQQYAFTITSKDGKVWNQLLRVDNQGAWMTFDAPDFWAASGMEHRMELRTRMMGASLKYQATEIYVHYL